MCPLGKAAGVAQHRACPFAPRERTAGARLYFEGEPGTKIYYLWRGQVALTRAGGDARGAGVTWAVRRGGDLLGAEILVHEQYLDTAVTLGSSTVCAASRESIDAWIGPPESPARTLLQLSLRTRCSEVPRRSGADGKATRRLARWLLDEAADGAPPKLPKQVIAALLGMLPETLSRALARLASAGAIAVDRRTIRVIDVEALRRVEGDGDA